MRTISSDYTIAVQLVLAVMIGFMLLFSLGDLTRGVFWPASLFLLVSLLFATITFRLSRVSFDGSAFYFSAYFVERRAGAECLESVHIIKGKPTVIRLRFRSRIYLSKVIYFVPADIDVEKELRSYASTDHAQLD